MPKANSAFMSPMNVSPELAAVVGNGPMPRSEVVSKLWEYIKKNNLQDTKDKRIVNTDEKLKKIFGGQPSVHMMKMAGFISKHVSKPTA
jgi:chromatin remodeling complex protein RSC6